MTFVLVKKKIGNRIRKIRESKDLKREYVADELGITHGAYSKIERGDSDSNTSRLLQIAEILDVSVTDFFEDAVEAFRDEMGKYGYATREEMTNLTKMVNALFDKIEKLTSEVLSIKRSDSQPKKRK